MPCTITHSQAAAVVEAFGPCTAVYECGGPDHVLDMAEDHDSLTDIVRTLLTCEDISAERMDDTGACYREWREARPAIVAALRNVLGVDATLE